MNSLDIPEPLLIKPSEAADMLGIGMTALYRLIADGTIPSVRLGPKIVRIPLESLKAWLKQQEAR